MKTSAPLKTFLRVLALSLAFLGTVAAEQAVPTESKLRIRVTAEPIFPHNLRNEGVKEGRVLVAIAVDDAGMLRDHLVVQASHRDFARAVDRVIDRWSFEPPRAGGLPYGIAQHIEITFRAETAMVLYSDASSQTALFLSSMREDLSHSFKVVPFSALDKIPEPIHVERPRFFAGLVAKDVSLNAVFEFYIDEAGAVHIPALRYADDDVDEQILHAVQEALWKWRFSPPTVRGRPVIAKAAQPFVFTNGELEVAER